MYKYYIPFFIALIMTYLLTPLAKRIAYKIGAIDVPKDGRRVHTKPMPKLGGLAIYLSTMITITGAVLLDKIPFDKSLVAIMLGGTVIVVVGIIDDIKPISAKFKFVAQIVVAIILVMGNVTISFVENPFIQGFSPIHLDILAIPATIFWVVGITNTVNLIDGLDGLAAGVGGIASLSMFFVASNLIIQYPIYASIYGVVMIMSAVLAGASFGFLPHNFNPARIFMGDTGSLFLGYMLSVISITGVMKRVTIVSVILPILILGLPIFDTTFAIIRRVMNKRPISEADKGHLHHRLLERGLTHKQTVLTLYVICIALGSLAVILTGVDTETTMITFGIIMAFILILGNQIGVIDLKREKK